MRLERFRKARLVPVLLILGLSLICLYPAAQTRYSDWSTPINLGTIVNSTFEDSLPQVSKNGLSLYFASTRPSGFGGHDIWVCQRAKPDDPWGTPVNLGGNINTSLNERGTGFSNDQHFMFLVTDRPGGFGGLDIWVSWRANTHDDLGWQLPVNLGDGVNSPSNDAGPSHLENNETGIPQLYFASNRPGGLGDYDIYLSELTANGSFGPSALVNELSSAQSDLRPAIRRDGLEIFINSSRAGTLGFADLWVSTRRTVQDVWSAPENLGTSVNSAFQDAFPSISSDDRTLLFSSNRQNPGSPEGFDLYLSFRTRLKRPD
jgi:hypothetical protein